MTTAICPDFCDDALLDEEDVTPVPAIRPAMTLAPIRIPVTFTYDRTFVPPRCRTPRHERAEGHIVLEIPRLTPEEAPVALEIQAVDEGPDDEDRYSYCREQDSLVGEYRVWNGRLWQRMEETPDDYLDAEAIWRRLRPCRDEPESEVRQKLEAFAAELAFIDGRLYEPTGEPVYRVDRETSFHRGTEVSVSMVRLTEDRVSARHFRADELPLALEFAQGWAAALREFDDEDGQENAQKDAPPIPAPALRVYVLRPDALKRSFRPSPTNTVSHTIEVAGEFQSTGPMPLPYLPRHSGYRLDDGRFLIPTLAFRLVDEASGTQTLVSEEDVARVGLVRIDSYKSHARLSDETPKHYD